MLGDRRPAQQVHHVRPVDRVIGRLAHPQILERAAGEVEQIGPVVRVDIGDDLHARGFQPRDRIGRGRLDPVDLASEERGGAGRSLRHRD